MLHLDLVRGADSQNQRFTRPGVVDYYLFHVKEGNGFLQLIVAVQPFDTNIILRL
jgi:hypothetical protein